MGLKPDLDRMSKSELIAEVRRLRGEPEPKFEEVYGRVEVARRPKKEKPIHAGMDLKKDDLLVVDEAKRLAYVHPEVEIVPGEGWDSRIRSSGLQEGTNRETSSLV